jgi:hypothetical protein
MIEETIAMTRDTDHKFDQTKASLACFDAGFYRDLPT